jgi:hypothetical protein
MPTVRRPLAAQRAAATEESTPPDIATATTAPAGTRSKGSAGTCAPGRLGAVAVPAAAGVISAVQRPPATAGTMESSSRSPTGVSRPSVNRMSESLT